MIRSPLRRRLYASTAIAALAWAPAPVSAQTTTLPDAADGRVVGGALGGASIGRAVDTATGKDTLTVTVDGNRPVIEWTRFGVGADQAARFVDDRGAAARLLERATAVLNRVTGDDSGVTARSDILGELTSSPTLAVYLTNPQGILFGPNANVTVGSLVATTLAIDPDAFKTAVGTLRLSGSLAEADAAGSSPIAVEVQSGARLSTLGSGAGGRIALIGARVASAGTLDASNVDPGAAPGTPAAPGGTVALVAATDVRVSFDPDSPLTMTVTEGSPLSNLMAVSGTLKGASVLFAAATEGDVRNAVLGIDADVEATTAVDTGAGVLLVADRAGRTGLPVTMDLPVPGTPVTPSPIAVTLGGTLTARGERGAVRLYADGIAASGAGATVDASTDVAVEASGDVALDSVTAGISADLLAGGAMRMNSATAGIDLTLEALGVEGLALDGAGDPTGAVLTATDGTVSLTAGGSLLLGDVVAGGDVGIGAATVAVGNVTAGRIAPSEPGADRVRIEATGTSLRAGDVTVTDGGADLRSAQGMRVGDVTADAVRAEAGHALTAGTLTARTGDVDARATGLFAVGGAAGGVTATRVSAVGGSVLVQTTDGGTIDLASAAGANAVEARDGARLVADGAVSLRGGASVTAGGLEVRGPSVTLGDGTSRLLSASGQLLVQATASALTGGEGVTLRSGAAGDAVVLRAAEGIGFAGRAEATGRTGGTPGERTGDVILQPGDGSALRLGGGASGRSLLLRSPDGTATGQLNAGGDVTLGSVDVDRSLTIGTSGRIRLADVTVTGGDLTLSGVTVNATGALAANTVTARGDGLMLRNVDSRSGETALLADFGVTAGDVTGTGVVVSGGRDLTLAAVDARTGLARVEAGRAVEVTGSVRGTGAQVTAGAGLLRLGGADARTGTLTLRSDDGAIQTGRLAGAGVEARGANGLRVGDIQSSAGVMLASSRGSATATGAVTAATGIEVTAASDVELSAGGTTGSGELTLLAGQLAGRSATVRAGGALGATAGNATLTGADGVSVAGVSAGGNTILAATAGMVTSGALGGAAVTASGRTGVATGAVTATVNAQLTSLTGQVTTGNVQGATGVLLDGRTGVAAGDVAAGTGQALLRSAAGGVAAGGVSGRGVEVTAQGTVALGTATDGVDGGTGSVQLTSDQGRLTVLGRTAGEGVTVGARDGVTLGDVAAGAGDARLSSGLDLDAGDVAGGLVRLNGVGDVGAGQLSGGTVEVVSAAGIALGGAQTTSGDIVLDAEDAVTVSGALRARRDVAANGGGALGLGEVRGRDVMLRSRGAGIVAGDVTAERLLEASAATGSRFGALTAETIRLRIDAEGLTAGNVVATNDLLLDTAGDIVLGDVGVSAGEVRLTSRGTGVATGAIDARADVAVQGATGVRVGGAVSRGGSVRLTSGTDVTATGRVSAPGGIRVDAQTGVSLTDAVAGDAVNAADLLVAAPGGGFSGGALTASRTLSVVVRDGAVLDRATAGLGGLTIRSTAGLVRLNELESRGDADLSGRTGLALGSARADGALDLSARNGDIRMTRASAGGRLAADASGLLSIDAAGAGVAAALVGGSVTLGTATAPVLDVTARGGGLAADELTGRTLSLTQAGAGDLSIGRAAAADALRVRAAGGLLADRLEGAAIDAAAGGRVDGRTRDGLSVDGGALLLAAGGTARLDAVTLAGTGDVRAGELNVVGNVAAGGDLTLLAGSGATLGAGDGSARSVTSDGRLTLTAQSGAVTGRSGLVLRADAQDRGGARDLSVTGGNGIAFAANTLLAGGADRRTAVRLAAGTGTGIVLDRVEARALTAADGTPTLTHAGAIRVARLAVRDPLSLRAEGPGGTIALGRAEVAAGGASLFATGDVAIDRLVAGGALGVTSARGDIGGPATVLASGGALTLRADAASGTGGAIRLASATAPGDMTLVARTIAADVLATEGSLTADTRRALATPADQSIAVTGARVGSDATIRSGGALLIDTLAAGGTLDAGAAAAIGGRTGPRATLTADRGAVRVAAGGDAVLARAAAGTDLSVTAAGLDATTVRAGGGTTLTASGAMTLGTVSADGAAVLVAGTALDAGEVTARSAALDGGSVTVERAEALGGDLTLTARLGAARAALARARDALTMSTAGDAAIGTANAGGALRIDAGGDLRADDLAGTSVNATATGAALQRIAAGAGGLDVATRAALQLEQAVSQGGIRLSAGTDATLGTLTAAGDVVAAAGGLLGVRDVSGAGIALTGDAVTVGRIAARGAVSVTARTGDMGVTEAEGADLRFTAGRNLTLGRVAAMGLLQASAGERLSGADLSGATVALSARNAALEQVTAGTGGLDAAAGEVLRLDRATSGGATRLVAGTDATVEALAAAGNVVARAGNLLTVGTLSGENVELTGATIAARSLTSRGPLTATAQAGDLDVTTAEGADLRFTAARNLTLGQAATTGLLQAGAGERLAGADLRGATVVLSARNAALAQVAAGAGGLDVAAGESLVLDRATSGGTARLVAGTDATLRALDATGNVVAQAGNLLTVGTLSGAGVELTGTTVAGDDVTARGLLTATARAGSLTLGTAQAAAASLAARGDAVLGTVSATEGLEANAGGRLTATQLRAGTLSVSAREAGIDRLAAGRGGASVATLAGLRIDSASSDGAARLVAGTDATLGTVAAAGDVAGEAGGTLDVRTLSGGRVDLAGAGMAAGAITARGPLTMTARTGDLAVTTAQAAEARFRAAGDVTLGTVSATGLLQADAGGRLSATDLNGGTIKLTGRTAEVAQLAARTGGVEVRAREDLRIDRATSAGAATLAAGTDAVLGLVSATGDLSAEAGGRLALREASGAGVTLTGGTVAAETATAGAMLTATARSGDLSLTTGRGAAIRVAAFGNASLGSATATSSLQAVAGERLIATELRGATLSVSARGIALDTAVAGSGGLEAAAGEALQIGQVSSDAGARISGGTDVTLGTLAASGNVAATAGRALVAQSLSGGTVGLTGGSVEAGRVAARDALTMVAQGGDLRVARSEAGSARFEASGDAILGTVVSAGDVIASATGTLGLGSLAGANADLAGRAISVDQVVVPGLLKARAGADGLGLVRAEVGSADLGSRGGATLGMLAARQDATVDVVGVLDAGTVSGASVTLLGGSVAVRQRTAAGLLTATARAGNLGIEQAEVARARLDASGDATLGSITATGVVTAQAGGALTLRSLAAAESALSGRSVAATRAVVGGALSAAAGAGGLSFGTLESGSARLTSGADATLTDATIATGLSLDATGTVSVVTARASEATLAGGALTLGDVIVTGPLAATARGGDLRADRATAGTAELSATGNAVLGSVSGGGRVAVRSGGALTADLVEGGDVTLEAGGATLNRVAARGALGMATTARLAVSEAVAGTTATVTGREVAATTLTAGGAADVRAQASLTAGTLRATTLALRGGSVSAGTATASAGDLSVASGGALGLGAASATGGVDLAAAGDATLGSVEAGRGLRLSAAALDARRLVAGTAFDARVAGGSIGTAEAGGALSAAATGDLRLGTANAGGALTLGSGGALAVGTLRATDDAALTATGAASVSGGATVGGAYRVRGTSVTLGTAGTTQRQSARDIALEANAATLLGATTLAASGALTVTAGAGAGTIAFAPDSLVQAATVQLSAAGRADLGGVVATDGVAVSSADMGLTRTVRGASVRLANNGARGGTRLGGAPGANAAEFQAAGNGFDLDGTEIGLVQTPDLAIAGGARDMAIGALTVGDGTGAQRLSLLTTGRIDVLGRVAVQGVGAAGARQVTLGGSGGGGGGGAATRSSVVRVAATQDGGGRLLMGTTALTINGDRIGIGLDRDFLDTIGFRGAGLSVEQVTRDYVARPTSTLYNAGALGAMPYADGTLLQAHSLSLGYGRYALIQNTAPAGEQRGAILGVLGRTPATPTLSLRVNDANNTFALFGTIDGISSSAAALLGGDRISVGSGVSPLGSRVNGCVIGSGGGCLTASIAQPAINLFNTSRAEVVRSADDLSLPFDPLVGTNNESLYLDPAQEAAQSSRADCNEDDAQCRPVS